MRKVVSWMLVVALMGGSGVGMTQSSMQQQGAAAQSNARGSMMNDTTPAAIKERAEAQRLKMEEEERHKKLLADTEKLLKLATELRAEVEKSGKEELNVVVVRKAAEMEKLARDVKERMKN